MIAEPLVVRVLRQPGSALQLSLPEWDLLIRQARRGNLLARVQYLLAAAELIEQVPHQPRRHLEWARVTAQRHVQAVHTEVARIRTALAGQTLVLLKGAAYVTASLPPAIGRVFSDIDIMVPKNQLPDVESALMVHGWLATHHDAYDQRYYREWMHELPPLQHITRETVIDVHHAILPLTMAAHPDSRKLLAAAVPAVPLSGHADLLVLAPVDMVLHSAAHLFYEGELHHGLRDLTDIDALLRHFSADPLFWSALVVRAAELELTRILFYALRFCRLLLHTPVPAQTIIAAETGQPAAPLRWLMDQLYRRALLPQHKSCADGCSGLANRCLYIRATWLRMPPLKLARHLIHKAFFSPKE